MEFRLSASLKGHDDDVRAVSFPDPSFILSASRDATVRAWKLTTTSSPPIYDDSLISHGQAFVNALTFAPPSSRFPEGLVISGGKETIIEAKQPSRAPNDNAEALLLGHQSNVCALDVSEDGRYVISGSWDTEARVWEVGKWDTSAVLRGHQASVWAVLSYDKDTIITGCADKNIRIYNTTGKLLKTIKGSEDVVRALCKLPEGHPTGAQLVSAGNDAVIRLWTLEGVQIGELHGHQNFIYTLAVLPDGDLVSGSEDRTVRIWKGADCIQTITHPAISVWSVAVCAKTGDIATGASDHMVRVFTRSKEREAEAEVVKAFTDAVQSSAIPQQSLPNINKEELPGPNFIRDKSGTKEGQVQMIRELNGNVCAYQWTMGRWENVGTVVDAAGSSGRKTEYAGKEYDYVFDVDIEDGKPPLKLAYNLAQNPYEAARKFIDDNELPVSYLDQVANFITTNTQGATIGTSQTQAPGSDPWGTESRYRPGDIDSASQQQSQTPASRPKVLPQTEYLSIATGNLAMIYKKLLEFNKSFLDAGNKDISLSPSDEKVLAAAVKQLETSAAAKVTALHPAGIDVILRIIASWPQDKLLPALDLLRIAAASSSTLVEHTSSSNNTDLISILASTNVFSADAPVNNLMMAIRTLANLFNTDAGLLIVDGNFTTIHSLLTPQLPHASKNRNLAVAITTLLINYAVLLRKQADSERALSLLESLTLVLDKATDSEVVYRGLVAVGTVLSYDLEEVRVAAREVFEVGKVVERRKGMEARIRGVGEEIKALVG